MAANTLITVGNLDTRLKVFDIAGFIVAPLNGTYTLMSKPSDGTAPFDITELNVRVASGTCTTQWLIAATPITWTGSLTSIPVTSTTTNTVATAGNRVGIAAKVTLTVSAVVSAVGLEFTLKCVRV